MKWAALGVAVLAVLAIAWFALETRYQSCVEAAPVVYDVDTTTIEGTEEKWWLGEEGTPPQTVAEGVEAERDTSECSRLP